MPGKLSLLLVGAGNMGGALLEGWLREDRLDLSRSAVVDPVPSDRLLSLCEARHLPLNPIDVDVSYDIVVLAVKPQMFPTVIEGLALPRGDNSLFVSVAAGLTLAELDQLLKPLAQAPRVVRTMPNLPAAVGEGVTLIAPGPLVTGSDREAVDQLFEASGTVQWTEDERQLDRLMGLSGCGPAYVFLLIEAMTEAAMAEGLSPEAARRLAEETILGAAGYARSDGRPADELRAAVTSPGGTTAAALSVLDNPENGFRPLLKDALEAAFKRAHELRQG